MSKKKNKSIPEQQMDKLLDHLKEKNFSSIEEIKTYLDTLSGQPLEAVLPEPNKADKKKSQELVYKAYEAASPTKTKKLMKEALSLDPDNVDALCYQGDMSDDIAIAITYYQQAVEAGKRVLGKEFEELEGHFWGFHETRPFMRAKASLAESLYFDEQYEQAIQHYWEMLELNPNDNQGIRYSLATCLLERDDVEGYKRLHHMFEEDAMASSMYNHALFLFKTEGDTAKSRKALKDAIKQNKFVPDYLLEKKELPQHQPQYIGYGDENEAIEYVGSNLMLWKNTPNALMWLSKHI